MIHKPARFIETSVANAQSCINMYQDPTWKLDMLLSVEVSSPTWLSRHAMPQCLFDAPMVQSCHMSFVATWTGPFTAILSG